MSQDFDWLAGFWAGDFSRGCRLVNLEGYGNIRKSHALILKHFNLDGPSYIQTHISLVVRWFHNRYQAV